MKQKLLLILVGILILGVMAFPCAADDDPILLDVPNEAVFDCMNDIFIEVTEESVIGKQTAQRSAENNFLYMTVKILYLAESEMKGLDKSSFTLKHGGQTYPLNFAVSMISNRIKNYSSMGRMLSLPTYWTLNLVFDVDAEDKDNWTLVFTPTERGGNEPYCQIDVPLTVK